jgi:hypothetical protein
LGRPKEASLGRAEMDSAWGEYELGTETTKDWGTAELNSLRKYWLLRESMSHAVW